MWANLSQYLHFVAIELRTNEKKNICEQIMIEVSVDYSESGIERGRKE